MPTLRRSKSLNDKAARQKSRSGDVIRHPKSPEPGERTRTRTCLDNYQLLVHLRKQTDDKSRQLELAYTYGGNAHSFLRSEGARRIPGGRPLSELHPSPSTLQEEPATGVQSFPERSSAQAAVHCRQHSADDDYYRRQSQGRVVKRQEGQQGQGSQQPAQRCPPRPMSMFERRACSPVPSVAEWDRKDQIIKNLMESQRCANSHNQKLLGKVDDLQSENARLKEILNAYNLPYNTTVPRTLRSQKGVVPLTHEILHSPSSDKLTSTLVSPISETSVSGYGSLTGSGYGEGHMATLEAGRGGERRRMETGMTEEAGGYNDDTLPLSELSGDRVGSEGSTLPSPYSSGGNSRVPTLNRSTDKADLDSLHEKLDQVLELERLRGSDRKKRIVELEQLVIELTEQRKALLERYRLIVDQNEKLQARDERIREELGALLQQHGRSLQQVLCSELQQLQQELQGLGEDLRGQLDSVLTSLASWGPGRGSGVVVDPQVRELTEKVVDLIGPEYLRLGRQLHIPPLELERIEKGREDFAHKTRRVLQYWLRRRREEEEKEEKEEEAEVGGKSCGIRAPPVQVLSQALRDIDKDIRFFNQTPISTPERQALRNCLHCVIRHVIEPNDVIDHLITLNELTPAGITFVQEVVEENRERALCRLWHVMEYRGNGIISRLALALERAGYQHVSKKLTEELEIQNAQYLSHNFHPLHEDRHSLAAQNLGSRPSPSDTGRSRPKSGWIITRPSPAGEPAVEAVGLPVRPLSKSQKTTPVTLNREDSDIVWSKQETGSAASNSPKRAPQKAAVPEQRTRISRV